MSKNNDIKDDNDMVVEADDAEIEPEDSSEEDENEHLKVKLKKLRTKLAQTEAEKREYLENLQRTRADFLNTRRRLEEQLARDKERAVDNLLMELLVLVDSFDTAQADTKLWNSIDKKWREGIEAIQNKLMSVLSSHRVVKIDALNKVFNPAEHEAVSNTSVEDPARINTVITVLQNGFKRNDEVIRPARVVVGTE